MPLHRQQARWAFEFVPDVEPNNTQMISAGDFFGALFCWFSSPDCCRDFVAEKMNIRLLVHKIPVVDEGIEKEKIKYPCEILKQVQDDMEVRSG